MSHHDETPTGRRKSAVVTGGAKGIGRAISEELARAGWDVVLCGRDRNALDRATIEIQSRYQVGVQSMALDLSEPEAVTRFFARWKSAEELPPAMVCGAADYGVLGSLDTVDFAAWKRSFDLNFFSIAEMIHAYLRIALAGPQTGRRSIVVMAGAGLGSRQVAGGVSAYSCSKAALNRLVEVVHEEVHDRGVDINCVLPGLVNTGMVDQAVSAGPKLGELYAASLKARSGGGTPPEVAAAMVATLLDDKSSGVSGRLLSAKWDAAALSSPAALVSDPDLFRLRRIDRDLYGKLK